MSWDAFIDPIAGFLGQDAESQVEQGNVRTDLDGKYKPTFMDQFWGRANDGQAALNKDKNRQLRDKYQPQLEALGGSWVDGMSSGSAAAEVQRLQDDRSRANTIEAQNLVFNDPARVAERQRQQQQYQEGVRRADRQFAASRQDVANQMELTRLSMEQANKNNLLDRADAREAKAAELEYAKIRDRKADLQYNERMEQLDRRDRRQGITSIAAGLAALGAAFAL